MPPKPSTTASPRGRPVGSKNKASTTSSRAGAVSKSSTATAIAKAKVKGKQRAEEIQSPDDSRRRGGEDDQDESMEVDEEEEHDDEEEEEEPEKSIPPDLLTRILHEFFEKDGTRITKDANNAMAKYMDVFVKEAIARAAAERTGGFLEVSKCPQKQQATPYEILSKIKIRTLTGVLHVDRLRISKRLLHSFFWICECRALQRVHEIERVVLARPVRSYTLQPAGNSATFIFVEPFRRSAWLWGMVVWNHQTPRFHHTWTRTTAGSRSTILWAINTRNKCFFSHNIGSMYGEYLASRGLVFTIPMADSLYYGRRLFR